MSENSVKGLKISGLPKGGKLKQSDIDFMKLIEGQNFERVKKLQRTRKNNLLVGKNCNFFNSKSCLKIMKMYFRLHFGRKCHLNLLVFHVQCETGEILGRF